MPEIFDIDADDYDITRAKMDIVSRSAFTIACHTPMIVFKAIIKENRAVRSDTWSSAWKFSKNLPPYFGINRFEYGSSTRSF